MRSDRLCDVFRAAGVGPWAVALPTLYTADLGELATGVGLSYHFYADDTQLYGVGSSSIAEANGGRS